MGQRSASPELQTSVTGRSSPLCFFSLYTPQPLEGMTLQNPHLLKGTLQSRPPACLSASHQSSIHQFTMASEISFPGMKQYIERFLVHAYRSIDYLGLNAALYEWAESYDSKVSVDLSSASSAPEHGTGLGSPGSLHCPDHADRLSFISRQDLGGHASRRICRDGLRSPCPR